ncbi:MAG: hypothetical protein WKG06_41440 [Segetibacter sp.]
MWQRIVASKKLDIAISRKIIKNGKRRYAATQQCKGDRQQNQFVITTWNKLQLTELLLAQGFTEEEVKLAATQVISRAVYPASELKTTRWIKDNSAVCELTGYDINKITKDKLYQSALHLYKVKDALEKHLSKRTNEIV